MNANNHGAEMTTNPAHCEAADLETVITTAELSRRPSRLPDHAAENRALVALAREVATSPNGILQKFAETALTVCRAHSAGFSLLESDGKHFHWPAIAGQWASHVGGGTPREFGPCGTVLDRNAAQLMSHPERHFTFLAPVRPWMEEVLLIPFYVEGKAVGTIWVMSHDQSCRFDAEDLRVMTNLGTFAAAAYEVSASRDALKASEQVLRQSQERLEVSETRYRRLIEAAKDGILILDTQQGRITDANPFMVNLLGYTRDELVGKELWQIGLFQDVENSQATIRQLQSQGYVRYEHLPLETTRGRKVAVEVVANVYQEDHQPVIQCNIRDITDRTILEDKTKQQAKALADLSRRKDEFLAMLSHELRNPLAPILNAVQLLRLQKDRTLLQQDAHGMIERQVGQLARLVDDLLEVSRISTGRIHLQEERTDLRGIVNRAIETTRPQAGQKGHSVAAALPSEPIWIYGDAMRLEQVVVNLLNNACKYTDHGGHIWVGLEQAGDEAVLRVRDNGIGIAPEVLPRIFDLFTQADKSLDRSQGGLGIGLALVQSLVTMHRGSVEAKSTVGQGSEFIVRLPIFVSVGVASHVPLPTLAPPSRPLKVLVVDDNADAAKGVAMLLRASGHDARTAHDGASAMQAALEYSPQVVLLDIGLPVINGYDVARWIRHEPALENVVLIALTGYGQETDKQRSQEAGFDHHLVKPVDFAKVQQILATIAEKAP
jgi:PAS domain S-box-containing protein